jgi:hypothetical protein
MAERKMTAAEVDRARNSIVLCEAYERLFNTEDGKLVLADLERRGCINETTYDPAAKPEHTIFNEGRRSIVLHVRYAMRPETRDDLVRRVVGTPKREQGEIPNG